MLLFNSNAVLFHSRSVAKPSLVFNLNKLLVIFSNIAFSFLIQYIYSGTGMGSAASIHWRADQARPAILKLSQKKRPELGNHLESELQLKIKL